MITEEQGYVEVVSNSKTTSKKQTPIMKENKSLVKFSNNGSVDLSNIEPEKLTALQNKADTITNDNILTLGSKTQSGMSKAADTFLNKVRSTDVNVLGNTLLDLKKEITQIDLGKLQPMGPVKRFFYSLPGMTRFRGGIRNMFDKYDDINDNVNKLVNTFVVGQVEIVKDNESLSIMKLESEKNILDITDDLIVAQIKIDDLENEISEMRSKPDEYDINEIADKELFKDNLERHAADLNITRVTIAQSLIDTRIIRQGNDVMLQKINSAINNTLPIWKQTMALGVSLARQKAGIDKLEAFTNYTNQMLIQKAEMVNTNSVAIAKANERGIVDYDTLKKVHELTINTLKELETIQKEGKTSRGIASENIKKLIVEMDNSVLNVETKVISATDTKKIK